MSGRPVYVYQLPRICLPAALATEDPTPDLLTVPPNGQSESIINKRMWKHVLTQVGHMQFRTRCMS